MLTHADGIAQVCHALTRLQQQHTLSLVSSAASTATAASSPPPDPPSSASTVLPASYPPPRQPLLLAHTRLLEHLGLAALQVPPHTLTPQVSVLQAVALILTVDEC